MFVGDFQNKNLQFYDYQLFSDVKLRHFFKHSFRTASEILFTDIKLYCHQGPDIQKMLIERFFFSGSKGCNVTAYFSAFHKLKHNVKIVAFYHVLTPAPRGPTLKQKSDHIKRVISSNCTKFLKYTHKMLLLEIIQNIFKNALLFQIAKVSTNFPAKPRIIHVFSSPEPKAHR